MSITKATRDAPHYMLLQEWTLLTLSRLSDRLIQMSYLCFRNLLRMVLTLIFKQFMDGLLCTSHQRVVEFLLLRYTSHGICQTLHVLCLQILLDHGASKVIRTKRGMTSYNVACCCSSFGPFEDVTINELKELLKTRFSLSVVFVSLYNCLALFKCDKRSRMH